jgi:hypothetical protein
MWCAGDVVCVHWVEGRVRNRQNSDDRPGLRGEAYYVLVAVSSRPALPVR